MNKKILFITASLGMVTASSLVAMPIIANNVIKSNGNVSSLVSKETKIVNEGIVASSEARKKTAWGWTVEDITSKNFHGLPTSGNGKVVKIVAVDNFPDDASIKITIQFSTIMEDNVSVVKETKIYAVSGFKRESLQEKVDRIYSQEITPTREASQIPAIEENWTLEDINDKNFINLPKSKDGIDVKLLSLSFDNSDPLDHKMILNYSFSWMGGVNTIEKSFVVSGFESKSYNSNLAAQNHYKLVALYRMLNMKAIKSEEKAKISTDEFERGGIDFVKKYFDVPEDRQFNIVTLEDVITSGDNTYETYVKGKNMKLGTLRLKFTIHDWVNNVRTTVETQLFDGFENQISLWKDKFSDGIKLRGVISNSLFSFEKFYDIYGDKFATTKDLETGELVLNATASKTGLYEVEYSSYIRPIADWIGYKLSTYNPMYGHGESMLGMKDVRPDRQRFVNMITYDAKNNYLGKGPNGVNNSIEKPIEKGGVTEILRKYLFESTSNQNSYDYDWIVFKRIIEPSNYPASVDWSPYDEFGIPFGSWSVWPKIQFEYDVWVDYEKTTIKFNVELGMVDQGKISTSYEEYPYTKTY